MTKKITRNELNHDVLMHTGDMQETARLTGVSLEDIENVLTKLGPDPIPRKVRGKRKIHYRETQSTGVEN